MTCFENRIKLAVSLHCKISIRHSKITNYSVYSRLGNNPNWPEFELIRDFTAVLLTCKFEGDSIKMRALSSGQSFLHYKSMGGGAGGCRLLLKGQ